MSRQRDNSIGIFAAVAFVGLIIAAIIFAAIASDSLQTLLDKFVIALIIVSVLAAFYVTLYVYWSRAHVKAVEANNTHTQKMAELQNKQIEAMAKLGYLPSDNRYRPVQQIAAPASVKAQVPGSQIIFNQNALRESTTNLLLFTMRLLGEDSNRIASGPECAAANIVGYSGRTWDKMINTYLKSRVPDIATVPGPIVNGGGVYLPESVGTVKRLYDMLVLDSAVDALPDKQR